MKKLIYLAAAFVLVAACEKYDSPPDVPEPVSTRVLSESETILKAKLDRTAEIIADIIQEDAVLRELSLISDENRESFSLPFRDLFDKAKSISGSFSNLRNRFLEECSSQSKGYDLGDLAEYLAKNDCYLYCPYPSSFYPRGTSSYTVAAHPIDNDIENTGYRYEGKKKVKVKVNEKYTDKYMVLLIMPKEEDNDDNIGISNPDIEASKGDPVYEVRIGKIKCANYCGGLFEGSLELKVARGSPEVNISTGEIKGTLNVLTTIDYPRDYAKAAIKGWTVYSEGGWLNANLIWDSNWKVSKLEQCILVYEYDQVTEQTLNASLGYKDDPNSITISTSLKVTYRGDFLGLVEWDRDWFMSTNRNPGPDDTVKDGWVVRKTCPQLSLTTPLRVIY